MQCDMCGKETRLIPALVEGSEMEVCEVCVRFGKSVPRLQKIEIVPKLVPKSTSKPPQRNNSPQYYLAVVDNYADLIRQKRDSLGFKQEDLAKLINEKSSLLQKVESNHFKPNIPLARKLESFLNIKLIEQKEEEDIKLDSRKSDGMTIGDIIQIRSL